MSIVLLISIQNNIKLVAYLHLCCVMDVLYGQLAHSWQLQLISLTQRSQGRNHFECPHPIVSATALLSA